MWKSKIMEETSMVHSTINYGRIVEMGTGNAISVPLNQDLLILFEDHSLTDALASAGVFWADILHLGEITVPEKIFDYLLQFSCSYVVPPVVA